MSVQVTVKFANVLLFTLGKLVDAYRPCSRGHKKHHMTACWGSFSTQLYKQPTVTNYYLLKPYFQGDKPFFLFFFLTAKRLISQRREASSHPLSLLQFLQIQHSNSYVKFVDSLESGQISALSQSNVHKSYACRPISVCVFGRLFAVRGRYRVSFVILPKLHGFTGSQISTR